MADHGVLDCQSDVGDFAARRGSLKPRQVEQVAHEALEPYGLRLDLRREQQRLLDIAVRGGVSGGLGEQLDAGDRCLELVARVGDEVSAHSVEPRALGHVGDNDERASALAAGGRVGRRPVAASCRAGRARARLVNGARRVEVRRDRADERLGQPDVVERRRRASRPPAS